MTTALHDTLMNHQQASGIWGYQSSAGAIEPTCLALLALRRQTGTEITRAAQLLQKLQNADGSWSAFASHEQAGCWTTALATLTLLEVLGRSDALAAAIEWLVNTRGREANWFWRWKFKTIDNSVQFDPAKYGWSWVPGTTSWNIPTAFALIALRQIRNRGLNQTAGVTERIDMGVSMLLDRMCPGSGWNAGNGMAFGIAYAPYIDATAIALLALSGYESEPGVQRSLTWLVNRLSGCPSPYSLAWGILALSAYRNTNAEVIDALGRATTQLATLLEDPTCPTDDICTLATCALAFDAAEGENVFQVRV